MSFECYVTRNELMEKSNYWGYFCNRWISILSHLLYFKVCISNLTTNSKHTVSVWGFFGTISLMCTRPFQTKLNPDCTEGNNHGSSALNFISASSLFFSASPTPMTEDFFICGLCAQHLLASETAISQSHYLNLLSNWPTTTRLVWNQPRCKVLETASVYP